MSPIGFRIGCPEAREASGCCPAREPANWLGIRKGGDAEAEASRRRGSASSRV